MPNDYHTQAQLDRTKRLRELQHELPDFCSDYFMAIEQQTSVLTQLSYAYDLKLFFQYLSSELPKFSGKPVTEFTAADISQVTKQDLERYARYLTLYVKNETLEDGETASREMTNHEYGIKRKYASLRAKATPPRSFRCPSFTSMPSSVWMWMKSPAFWMSLKAGNLCPRVAKNTIISRKNAMSPCFRCFLERAFASANV